MTEGNKKRNRQLAFEFHNSRVLKSAVKQQTLFPFHPNVGRNEVIH